MYLTCSIREIKPIINKYKKIPFSFYLSKVKGFNEFNLKCLKIKISYTISSVFAIHLGKNELSRLMNYIVLLFYVHALFIESEIIILFNYL